MDILQAVVLGIVQGLGEFLPISSTAHLVLAPYFFGWEDPGLAFDVALHAGTLVAVLGYFWKDWVDIVKAAVNHLGLKFQFESRNHLDVYSSNLLWLLAIATIPGALAGYFLEDYAEGVFRHPLVIAFSLSFVGLLLYAADKFLKHKKEVKDMTVRDSIIIGIAQAIAIIPGVSRSGATMTAGLWAGLSREGAARFSFLMSTPIILGAVLAQFSDFFNGKFETVPLVVGVLTSAISGYLAIAFLLRFLQKYGFAIFVWYRIFLALVILAVYFTS
ncbi:MAG: Undecaprenyl-diphosphatase UppP [Candidatus Moranbacteria bacterium GW2011_GWE1_49_15]|nr:MAG: Undecaprenyl-diphosphatase UppP [Candidatus Moranbacteria bacterium GW2011_GWE2_47_10]KKW06426.1 MAG: Undecaprenyl-diphosphatase UppP [Candidatus Moranbacteria bacterium GW2011_GWE1_49_15]HBP00658.1 undecaprenyl-diphosphatase UppP [Candidatus Moranbacteria bacterium]